jgi:glycosyltransferase involved in cell wall biosynthesis
MNYEFILINDGSKDNTKREIEKLEKKHHFVKIVDYRTNM